MTTLRREQVLGFRVRAQQLDRDAGTLDDTTVLDLGVQDSRPDGGMWALAVRGVDPAAVGEGALVLVWTLRGAPHLYRRADLPSVAAAVQPFSDADAAKRIYDGSKPLKQAGIGIVEALDTVAAAMRDVVDVPRPKGDVSGALSAVLDPPYLRECRPCGVTHVWEMTFRLAALRAGLELRPDTAPPVLERIPGFAPAPAPDPRHDVVRGYLRLHGPATPKQVATFLDAPLADVQQRWPDDAVEVSVEGEPRWLLAQDVEALQGGPARTVRLLAPFDLYLQGRDRDLLVPDPAHAKALWPTIGRPGAVLVDGEVAGLWRPRKSGRSLRLAVEPWAPLPRADVEQQAERLAAARGVALAGVDVSG